MSTRLTTRETLVQTVLDLSSIIGFREITVSQVCAAARVAPRTFYNNFRDLSTVFAEGYRGLDGDFEAVILEAYREHEAPRACAEACVDAALEFVGRDQMAAEAFFVHGFAAGGSVADMRARRIEWMQQLLADKLAGGDAKQLSSAQAFAVEMAIGGALSVVFRCVSRGDLESLGETRELLVRTLLRPFAADPGGAVAAAAWLARAS